MHRVISCSAVIAVAFLLTLGSLQAQEVVPRLIQFNGVIQDPSGQPLVGAQSVTFAVYRDQQEGPTLWLETQNVLCDAQGRYAVLLGAATSKGVPLELFTSTELRWLGVRANLSSASVEQPRVLLVSVPYALKAADADTLGGKPASAYMLAPTSGPNMSKADATVSAMNGGGAAPVISAANSGNPGYLGVFVNATDLNNSAVYQNNGNIGIGTTNAQQKLQIQDSVTDTFPLSVQHKRGTQNGDFVGMSFSGTDNYTYGSLRNVRNDTTGTFDFVFQGTKFGFGAVDTMILKGNGNVGIGALTPTSRLQVQDTVTNTYGLSLQHVRNSVNGDFVGLAFAGTDNTLLGGIKHVRNDVTNGFDVVLQATPFGGMPADVLTASGTGNVGIGTNNPAAKLDVSGNLRGSQFISTIATGTAPLTVNSTTQVANLNASLLGGLPASSFGDITGVTAGAGLTGGATSGTATLNLSSAALTRGVTYLAGCDTCSVLADTDDQKTIFFNVVGTMTINSVTCFSDTGSPTINIQRDDGTPANVLSADLACSSSASGATTTSFVGAEATLNLSDKLDFIMSTAGGAAHRVTLSIKMTVN